MKVMTVLGTRPEIIRLSCIIPRLDRHCRHVLVHTGQNFDPRLSDIFFSELGIRPPDYFLGVRGDSFAEQVGQILVRTEQVLASERPDRLLILGDTNSGLAAVVAKRMAIPVYHMEAGNRCYDDRVPEETNRRIIDHSSDALMPYTERSRAHLLREGVPSQRIHVIGNPIFEVLQHYEAEIAASTVLARLGLEVGKYFLVTLHRAENADVESRLRSLTAALEALGREYRLPIVCSLHPRTRDKMALYGLDTQQSTVSFHSPFGFFDFVALERNAFCLLSDSGTVQEEGCIFRVANVTIRDVTERPETLESGSNMLSGAEPDMILRCVETVLSGSRAWTVPAEYTVPHVSDTVAKIMLGYRLMNPVG
jgi:UDP-N-acetylglucosamine 2-epimerase (non-hydrolysing)